MSCAALKMSSKADLLVERYQKFVHAIASKLIASMHLPVANFDELVAAGYLGLVEAAQRFDLNSGTEFKNFAFLRIRGAMIDSIRASSEVSGKAYRMARAWAAIQDLEESYSVGGVQQGTFNDEHKLAQILEFAASGALAFRFSMQELEEEVAGVVSDEQSHEDKIVCAEGTRDLRNLVGMLPEKEKIIIESYYFQEKTFTQIALETGSHSKSWISRLHARALGHLKELIEARGGPQNVL